MLLLLMLQPTHQIGDVGHLDRVVHDLGAGAAVALLEHGLVDDEGRLDVLGGFAHVAPVPTGAVAIGQQLVRAATAHQPGMVAAATPDRPCTPLEVTGVRTAFI